MGRRTGSGQELVLIAAAAVQASSASLKASVFVMVGLGAPLVVAARR